MRSDEYNYSVFALSREQPVIDAFAQLPVHCGSRAPSFPLEDLDGGGIVEMKELWSDGWVIVEFGSFT